MTVWRRFDWVFFALMIAVLAIGLVMINSAYQMATAEADTDWTDNAVLRQLLFSGIGLLAYVILAALDYRVLVAHAGWVFAAALVMLVITRAIANPIFGTSAWLELGIFGIQPSELSKVLVIVVLARILGESQRRLETPLPLARSIVAVAVPGYLVYLQRDLGMAMLLTITWVGMVFIAGVRWRHLLGLGALAAAAVPAVWFRLEDYMRGRVLEFVNPQQDPLGSSYNIIQALISIGSGGWWGKGFLHGTQSQLYFLRVRHTDFIFSVLAEEFGFIGSVLLLGLFAFVIMRMMRIAARAPDPAGRLIACGTATMLFAQAFINLGINVNLLPVTGLPLPLISYGGSSLMATLMAMGLVQSVAMRQREPQVGLLEGRIPRPR